MAARGSLRPRPAHRTRPIVEIGGARMYGQSNPSAVRARSAASRRSSAWRTAAFSSSSTPPCSAPRAAVSTPGRSAQLVDPHAEVAARGPWLELGERGDQRHLELERRLAAAAGVEVLARAQRELFAGQRGVASAEQRGEALLGAQHGLAPAPGAGEGRLDRAQPVAIRDLLALAVAEAHDERLIGVDLTHVRVGGRRAVQVKDAVEHGHRLVHPGLGGLALLAGIAQPALGRAFVGEGLDGDERRARDRHRRRLGHRSPRPAPSQPSALRRAHRGEDQHVLDLARVAADDVAPVLRSERPGELELDEAEQPTTRRRAPCSPAWGP
jgi:hypothetical protein